MVLITGASGMLGSYLMEQFSQQKILTLDRRPDSDFCVDLTMEAPDFGDHNFGLVIHAAGTEDDSKAMELNLEGTKRLIAALDKNPPREFVYVSSFRVYSRDAGENVNEETPTWATSKVGKSKALAENELKEWCEKNGIVLSIIRPARMFGNGVKNETLQLFNDALASKYIHIRGNDAKVSIVCAYDVAKGIKALHATGGIYNAADNHPVKLIDMIEAMTANAGAKKRMTHLPPDWAEWLWRLGKWIPSINRNLAPQVVEERMKTLTLDGSRFALKSGLEYHDTLAVIERTDKNYPYSHPTVITKKAVHEV